MNAGKPIHKLTADDLRLHPLWTYGTAGEIEHDETFVLPVETDEIPVDDEYAVFHVACIVVTSLGKNLSGFMSVSGGHLHDPAPVIVGEHGGYFPLDCPPTRKELPEFEAVAGAPFARIFPVHWQLSRRIAGEAMHREGSFTP